MQNPPAALSPPAIELMRHHRSVRKFKPDPLPAGWVETIIEAAQWASTSSFRQQYSVIAVSDPHSKRILRALCANQRWIEECPVFLAFCADTHRLDEVCQARGLRANLECTETFLMAAMDAVLVMQNAALAAEALGLGIVMIGGLRDNPREVIELLGLPRGVYGISGMCIGFPDAAPSPRPRLPLEEVLHWERYDPSGRPERLAAYDETIRQAQVYRRTAGAPEGWSDVMARTTSNPPREPGRSRLRQFLQGQGFEME